MRLLEIIWWSGVGVLVSGAVVSAIAIRKYHKLFEFAVSRTQQMRKYRDELMLLKQTQIRVLEPEPLNGLTNSNWGEDARAEYALGVHLEQKRMEEG